ncbi:N-acetylmuramoyl-L-alanine amidase [Novilysobacter arseniciresistens]|uniref:N-acetylmuramoyl-L-alanine amidase n=1 Tax=Novilysobacter arseniciresistens TaxID=1385522 RepID=UPI0006920B8B|nr:N-acetylmuramoyl-L-alanine amidase [Lysobacter arseniciresistens]
MRVKGATFQKFLLGLALLSALVWNLAHASEINGLHLSAGATGTRAEIALDKSVEFDILRLSAPDRLVVDLPGSSLADGLRVPAGAGVVKAIRTGQPVPGTARIVFDLTQPITALKPRIEPGASGPRLVLEWPGDGARDAVAAEPAGVPVPTPAPTQAAEPQPTAAEQSAASAAATSRLISELAARHTSQPAATPAGAGSAAVDDPIAAVIAAHAAKVPTTIATGVPTRVATGKPATPPSAAPAASAPAPVKTLQSVMGHGMRPLVIAIDPGHGGQDPGALGKNGTREKDVVLQISKELARQINATPGLKAYLTRDTDVFIPLNKRAVLARQAKADMFISIHADAAENRSADGSSVYVLSLKGASSQRARWLANKENASDLVGGVRLEQTSNTLASVLLDLTQSGHMKASEEAAGEILDGLMRVGNIHKTHIERANFAVLRTSDMPAMLVETAFISNPEEEKRLKDPAFQRKIAGAVLDGVNAFFTRQPPPGTMYAARAAAQGDGYGAAGGSP